MDVVALYFLPQQHLKPEETQVTALFVPSLVYMQYLTTYSEMNTKVSTHPIRFCRVIRGFRVTFFVWLHFHAQNYCNDMVKLCSRLIIG